MDGITSLFDGGKNSAPVSNFSPAGFNAGGLTARFDRNSNKFSVASGAERKNLFQQKANFFADQSKTIKENLLPLVKPGFGKVTDSRVQAVRDLQRKTTGDLSETLKRRRVFGSSFANDSIARTDAEFAKAEAQERSEAFLQELAITNDLINQYSQASVNSVNSVIENLNLEAEIAAQLSSQATSTLAQNAQLQADLNAQASSGLGKFIGTAIGTGVKLYGISQGVPA